MGIPPGWNYLGVACLTGCRESGEAPELVAKSLLTEGYCSGFGESSIRQL